MSASTAISVLAFTVAMLAWGLYVINDERHTGRGAEAVRRMNRGR